MKKLKIFSASLLLIIFYFFSDKVFAQSDKTMQAYLNSKTGKWAVVMTIRPTADSPPLIIKGLAAEREMIGGYCLHEVMHPTPGVKVPAFKRLADLAWNVNEQRWDYISIDTRATIGIMYFTYLGQNNNTISSFITSFPDPGLGPDQKEKGQAVYVRNEVIKVNGDHDLIRQYWRFAGKPEWLAVQYDYTRSRIK